jgi:hypothetical protein
VREVEVAPGEDEGGADAGDHQQTVLGCGRNRHDIRGKELEETGATYRQSHGLPNREGFIPSIVARLSARTVSQVVCACELEWPPSRVHSHKVTVVGCVLANAA